MPEKTSENRLIWFVCDVGVRDEFRAWKFAPTVLVTCADSVNALTHARYEEMREGEEERERRKGEGEGTLPFNYKSAGA